MRRVRYTFPEGRFQEGAKARMTDDELIAEVKRHWEHWAEHLGIQNWWITVQFKPLKGCNLQMEWHPGKYQRDYLYVNKKHDGFDFGLDKAVLHEACHIFNAAIDDIARDGMLPAYHRGMQAFLETQADDLASIIYRLHGQKACAISQNGNIAMINEIQLSEFEKLIGRPA